MPISNIDNKNIYWEQQRGNNCRIHSLNAYFGEGKISDAEFADLCSEYDGIIYGLESIKMDGFAECRSIISYIVDKYTNKYCQLVPINLRGVHKKNRKDWEYDRFIKFLGVNKGIISYFEFNKDHVWFNMEKGGEWYKIDSLSGVTKINKPKSFSDNGYLLIFDENMLFYEANYLIQLIKNRHNDDNFVSEIAFYNLFHLLKRIKLDYVENDASFNLKISNLKTIYKILKEFVFENRKKRISFQTVKKLNKQLNNIINIF